MAGPATLARGNVIMTMVLQINVTPVAVAANTTAEQNFTVPGLVTGDQVSAFLFQGAYPNSDVSYVNGRVAANNVATIAFQNGAGTVATPPAGNYYLEVNRVENLPPPAAIT